MTLTKAHMSQKIADDYGFLKGKATEVLEKLLDIIKKGLVTGEDVMISGFGKWNVHLGHRVMCPAVRAEPVGAREEIRLEDRFQH